MYLSNRIKKAFTLSEALLTLVIIGVVATLTIPFVYSNYRVQIRNIKVKNFCKIMDEALDEVADNNFGNTVAELANTKGLIGHYPDEVEKVKNLLVPYLPVAKDCGNNANDGCSYDGEYQYMNGETWANLNDNVRYFKLCFLDGSYLYIHDHISNYHDKNEETCALELIYDINGSRGPNRYGGDLFEFDLGLKNNKIYPYGYFADQKYMTFIQDDCIPGGEGITCAGKILADINY